MKRIIIILISLVIFISMFLCGCSARDAKVGTTALNVGSLKVSEMEFQICYKVCRSNFFVTYDMEKIGYDSNKDPFEQSCYFDKTVSWGQFFIDSAVDFCRELTVMCELAKREGMSVSEEGKKQISDYIASIRTNLEADGKNETEYWESIYGADVTVDDITKYMEKVSLYTEYQDKLTEEFAFTSEDLDKYYNDNKDSIDTITVRLVPFEYGEGADTSAQAKIKAKNFIASVTSEEDVVNNAYGAVSESIRNYFGTTDFSLTYNVSKDYFGVSTAATRWLFSDARKYMDSNVYDTGSMWLAMFFVEKDTKDYNSVDIRHILISDTSASGAERAASIYTSWSENGATEDLFAYYAGTYSADTASSANGGLYVNVYKGEFVSELQSWCFDSRRIAGDSTVLRSAYGYHILYFVSTGERYRDYICRTALNTQKYNDLLTNAYKEYPESHDGEALYSLISRM